jgi:hypothetical protein
MGYALSASHKELETNLISVPYHLQEIPLIRHPSHSDLESIVRLRGYYGNAVTSVVASLREAVASFFQLYSLSTHTVCLEIVPLGRSVEMSAKSMKHRSFLRN